MMNIGKYLLIFIMLVASAAFADGDMMGSEYEDYGMMGGMGLFGMGILWLFYLIIASFIFSAIFWLTYNLIAKKK